MNTKEQILEFVKQEDPDNPLQYVHNIVRQYAMDKLNRQILDCRDCDICNSKKSISYGNPDATLMIIAESVSDDQSLCEDEYVYPFVNEAGEIFKKVISQLNVNTNELFVINAVNCWPHKAKNDLVLHRTPSKEEVDNCKVFVDHSIRLVQPKAIILMGGIASNLYYKEAISKARGNWIEVFGIPAMPTYHPGYFLQIEGKKDEEIVDMLKWDFYNDIRKVLLYIQDKYPDNNLLLEPLGEE